MNKIKQNISKKLKIPTIDNYGVDGDFVKSQSFAFLAIRAILNYLSHFLKQQVVKKLVQGGVIIKIK